MSSTTSNSFRRNLFAAAVKRETVTVPDLGTVEVRGMTAAQKGRVVNQAKTDADTIDLAAYYPALLIETVYDPESGSALFTVGDTEAIGAAPADLVEQLANIAQRLSGGGTEAKVLEKNSGATANDAISSASPSA